MCPPGLDWAQSESSWVLGWIGHSLSLGWAPKYRMLAAMFGMSDVRLPPVDGLNILLKNLGSFLEGRIQNGVRFSLLARVWLLVFVPVAQS